MPVPKSPGTLSCINSGKATTSYSPLMRTIIRLWCHEVYRSFYDRMKSEEDRSVFSVMLNDVVAAYFCVKYEDGFAGDSNLKGSSLVQTVTLLHVCHAISRLQYQLSLFFFD